MTEIVPLNNVASTREADSGSSDAPLVPDSIRGGVITIGNFDGVHIGHAALLSEVRRRADEMGCPAVAVILDPHPAQLLRPDRAPAKLTWIERRAELMDRLGIDVLVVCSTTRELLSMTAEEFFESLVVQRLRCRAMVEGPNFFFGRDRGGNVDTLRQLCDSHNVELRIVDPTIVGDGMISSTRVRSELRAGNIETANRLLGVPHRIRGSVVSGAHRGAQIGFPTANLQDIDVVVPAQGVFGGFALVNDGRADQQRLMAAIHIGPNPTFEEEGASKVEVHLLDFEGDLYGESLMVDFITHVRDVVKFDSVEELVKQLNQDVATVRARLAAYSTT